MPTLTLANLLRAAWRLHLAGNLPSPRDADQRRIVEAGGMRPWIREAVGAEAATILEAQGVGNHWLGALLGRDGFRAGPARLAHDPADAWAMLAVGRICEDARLTPWSLVREVAGALEAAAREGHRFSEVLPVVAGLEAVVRRDMAGLPDRGTCKRVTSSMVVRHLLSRMARACGVDFAPLPGAVDPSPGLEVAIVASVTRHPPERCLRTVAPTYVFEAPDGHRWTYDDEYGLLDRGVRPLLAGMSVDLSLRGVMPGFRGYVWRVESHAERAWRDDIRRIVDGPAPLPPALSADGREIRVGDPVTLLHGCIEAPAGSTGDVVEVAGEMAVVAFGGIPDAVPCYASALSLP